MLIDQLLHGYSKGHRLLAASLEIDRQSLLQTSDLSDLAGTRNPPHFDRALRGYPLASGGHYSLAASWLAKEMPRPGSVWTHTLIIPVQALSEYRDLRFLLSYFRRPMGQDFSSYRERIDLGSQLRDQTDFHYRSPLDVGIGNVARTVELLYGANSELPVVVTFPTKVSEHVTIAIWQQQWPELRKRFSFSVAALEVRRDRRTTFDLTIVTPDMQESTLHNYDESMPGEILAGPLSWSFVAADDIVGTSEFGKFLWTYGSDLRPKRTRFSQLSRVFVTLNLQATLAESAALQIIDQVFGELEDDEGAELKRSLLSGSELVATKARIPDSIILGFILNSSIRLDLSGLDLKERAAELARIDDDFRDKALDLLGEPSQLDEPKRMILAGVIGSIKEFGALAQRKIGTDLVIDLEPAVLLESTFWIANRESFGDIWPQVLTHYDERTYGLAIKAVVNAGVAPLPAALVEKAPAVVIEVVLVNARAAQSIDLQLQLTIQRCAKYPKTLVLTAVSVRCRSLPLLEAIVAALSDQLLGEDDFGLARLANYVNTERIDESGALAERIVYLALNYPYFWAMDATIEAFEEAHSRAERSAESVGSASGFSFFIPLWLLVLPGGQKQDDQLRRALIARFLSGKWPLAALPKIASRPRTFRKILKTIESMPGGSELRDQLEVLASNHGEAFTLDQREILDSSR